MKRTLISLSAAILLLLGVGPGSDLVGDLELGPNAANAIDFFGKSDKDADKDEAKAASGGRDVFWRSESGIPSTEPIGIPTSFADLAERVAPAVVSIQTSGTVAARQTPMLPPGFEEFFGGNPWHGNGSPQPRKSSGEGSGFVISEDGYIVTNNHVVENMDEIQVHFLDGSELEAKVVGLDPKTDIALLKVEPGDKRLKSIALGDSDAIRAGDWVVAIGNPFGLAHTVTAGIVSAKHRRDVSANQSQSYDDFIQTDAAINPGNSGGPLIDLRGRVVGINTAIRSNANTIGFSVPINQAKQILPQLRAEGRVTRGWLGVQIQGVTPEFAEAFELEEARGALVSQVIADTPAAEAGIERGDVIIDFDGKPIDEWRDLPIVVASTPVESEAQVTVIRDGKKKKLRVTIGRLEDEVQLASVQPKQAGTEAYGLRAQDLTPALADQLGLSESEGVIVTEVEPGGPAAESGIRRGDIIVEIDRKPIKSARDLAKRLGASDKSVLVLVRRGDSTMFVPLKRAG